MAPEDHSQKCSNGGTGRSSKKTKQKKLPQRGLGVAQLEKIRLEEQKKKASSTNSSHKPMSNSFPSPSLSDFPSTNSMIKTTLPVHNMNSKMTRTVSVPEVVFPSMTVHDNLPKFLNPGLAFSRCNTSFPYESNSIPPLPDFTHRDQYHSLVNVSGISSSTSRSLYAIEPPSNQRYYGNGKTMFPEKVVSLKRSYPFPMDSPSDSYFSYKLPTFAASMRTDETVSYGNRSASVVRERPPSFSASMTESNSQNSNGAFLTLAPPQTCNNHEYPDLESLPYQDSVEAPKLLHPAALGRGFSTQERPFYCFLPLSTKPDSVQTTSNAMTDSINEMRGNVDLNLKL